jgi:hypothetical protein
VEGGWLFRTGGCYLNGEALSLDCAVTGMIVADTVSVAEKTPPIRPWSEECGSLIRTVKIVPGFMVNDGDTIGPAGRRGRRNTRTGLRAVSVLLPAPQSTSSEVLRVNNERSKIALATSFAWISSKGLTCWLRIKDYVAYSALATYCGRVRKIGRPNLWSYLERSVLYIDAISTLRGPSLGIGPIA